MTGLLLLDKPAGFTSHDAVAVVRGLYGERRVGHAGTLDPPATGLLVLCLGRATRLLEYLGGCSKEYLAEVVFGAATDSYDATGEVVETRDASGLTESAVEAALGAFRGRIAQVPPMLSAKQVGGQRLYRLHHQGRSVVREAVQVDVDELVLTGFEPGEQPVARLQVACGPGTYIRSLAHDLGEALGVGAHLRWLRRTRVGRFAVGDAVDLTALRAMPADERAAWIRPAGEAVAELTRIEVDDDAVRRLVTGLRIAAPHDTGEGPLAAFARDGRLVGVVVRAGDEICPRKVVWEPSDPA
ncbi:MAG: tRNA pseudouridine(55) synthase TruB [Armatimonadetes bacterium]|nr:tRNA pseudouridine(55) synthase TruB [Armatimonadota bacterium]